MNQHALAALGLLLVGYASEARAGEILGKPIGVARREVARAFRVQCYDVSVSPETPPESRHDVFCRVPGFNSDLDLHAKGGTLRVLETSVMLECSRDPCPARVKAGRKKAIQFLRFVIPGWNGAEEWAERALDKSLAGPWDDVNIIQVDGTYVLIQNDSPADIPFLMAQVVVTKDIEVVQSLRRDRHD